MRKLVAFAIGCVMTLTAAGIASAAAEPIAYTTGIGDPVCQLYALDVQTGAATVVGSYADGWCTVALARSVDGTLFGVTSDDTGDVVLVAIDTTTAVTTVVGPVGFTHQGPSFFSLAVEPDGAMWLYANSGAERCSDMNASTCLYRIDPATGAGTLVGGTANLVGGLTGSCADGLYATTWPDSELARVDRATGALTIVGALGGTTSIQGMTTGPDGTLWGLDAMLAEFPFHTVTIDPSTGAATPVASIAGMEVLDAGGIALTPPVCPQPIASTTTTAAVAPAVETAPAFTG